MNQISWLIYLSNISVNFQTILILLGIAFLAAAVVYLVGSLGITQMIGSWEDTPEQAKQLTQAKKMRRWSPALIGLACALWILAALCPSQETVLAIAASEFGEQLLHTKTANLAEQALDAWLQRQIKPAAP